MQHLVRRFDHIAACSRLDCVQPAVVPVFLGCGSVSTAAGLVS
jgi:hypothetical protein